ncbi:MAG: aminotransferase class I/II-fold pyridoxal phosphate-dependent enzyme [Gammaproteobacteria bacterium]|nr:aminotransferase class I/II-fold pyridoxal phosphate-dependent enzyme [Gammaproteobacteria bacterium]
MIPVLVPDLPTADKLLPFFKEIDHSKHYTNFGQFEQKLTADLERHYFNLHNTSAKATLTNSGTSALQLALLSLNAGPGTRVLVPNFTFPATVTAALTLGCEIVLGDVDDKTGFLDIEDALSHSSDFDIMIPVACMGKVLPCNDFIKIANEQNKALISDCAPAFPYHPLCGLTTFSFHATKPFGIGEGGLLLNEQEIRSAKQITNFGFLEHQVNSIGNNFKLNEYSAAIGLAQLTRLTEIGQQRKTIYQKLKDSLSYLDETCFFYSDDETILENFSYPYFILRFDDPTIIEAITTQFQQAKIGLRRWYYPTIIEHPYFSNHERIRSLNDLKTSKKLASQLIGIPMHNFLTDSDIKLISKNIKKVISHV